MKKQILFNCIRSCWLIAILILPACGSYVLEEEDAEEESSSKGYQMSLHVRSGGISLEQYYPLTVLLFNEEGELVEKTEITDTEETYSKILEKGEYTLTAFSGLSEEYYILPDHPTTNDYIEFKSGNNAEIPLLSGQSRISLTKNTQVNLSLSYAMAALNFNLQTIPEDADEVEIQVSPVSSGMSFIGNYSNDQQSYSIDCIQTEEGWETETFYVFPSESDRTNLSITIKRPDGNETYSYTYTNMLQPSQPYRFTGTFQDGISMGSTFEIEGWKPGLDISFNLNEETTEEEENNDDTETILRAPELPIAEKIWGYFYVWKVEPVSETEVIATLISPDQWYVLAADAPGIIEEYSIDHLDNWRVFTAEEAKEFKSQHFEKTAELNKYLADNYFDRFYTNDGARYLCENYTKTFSFSNNIVKEAGETVKYYLRGVKIVRVKLAQ